MRALPYIYLFGALLMPTAMTLAHGGEDDGHPDAVADPSQRKYVLVGVGVVLTLMVGWFIWSKIKARPPEAS